MLRKILIPLDTSKFTPVAIQVATGIANQVQSQVGRDVVTLSGLGILDTDQIPSGRFASMVPGKKILEEARENAESLVEDFRRQVLSLDFPEENVETRLVEGNPFRQIIRQHVFSDLVVMGEKCSFPPSLNDYTTLENIYHRSSRPILITPEDPKEIHEVLMFMDGTAASSRMLYAYAHLNPFPRAKLVILFSSREEEHYHLRGFFHDVVDFLERYRFEVERIRVEGDLAEELPGIAERRQAGAIAMGIHAEHFLDWMRKPIHLGWSPVENLLHSTHSVLFTVH